MIEAAKRANGFGDHILDRGLVRHVGLKQQGFASQFFDFGLHLFGLIAVRPEIDRHIGPLPGQLNRQGPPDPQ